MKVRTNLHVGQGLGDLVANVTHWTKLDQLAQWFSQLTGQDCGCEARQEALNQLVPKVPLT